MSIIVYDETDDLYQQVCDKLIAFSTLKKEHIHIALSGGSTPLAIFERLKQLDAIHDINWHKLHFWWVDERAVKVEDSQSNYGQVKRILLDHIDITVDNLHLINGALSPEQASINYVIEMKKHLPLANGLPIFDWIWLGMGDDGHTASLFVDGVSLASSNWTSPATHPLSKQFRITLTLSVINNARHIDFLVTGESKAKMIAKILGDNDTPIAYPAKFVMAKNGKLTWHLDKSAASGLKSS
ncbi:MAG: 6-phosphogluconolactonase [Francisellaceae bacterium]